MINQINVIKTIHDYPFAIFQDNNCVYQSGINDANLLNMIPEKIGNKVIDRSILVNELKTSLLLSAKYDALNDNNQLTTYLLTIIIIKKKVTNWKKHDWTQLNHKVIATLAILSNNLDYTVEVNPKQKKPNYDLMRSLSDLADLENEPDFVDNYQFEIEFMNQLKSENTILTKTMIHNLIQISTSQLATDALQNKKYYIVAFITLLTRFSVKNGCAPNEAYRLSNRMIRRMDRITQLSDTDSFIRHLIVEYTMLIQNRAKKYDSDVVNTAVEFISRNLYQPILGQDIANYADVNAAYLSSLFKMKTGISLHQYLINERVKESQYLLTNTDISIKDISEILYFSNQSHFNMRFKEKIGCTPKEFRIDYF